MNKKLRFFALGDVLLLGVLAWIDDFVTLQGERTICTVDCRQGSWEGLRCSGHLQASDRIRCRALRPHKEVVFGVVGSSEPSRKSANRDSRDGRHRTCPANGDAARSITPQLARGKALHSAGNVTRPFHATTKFHWLLVRAGFNVLAAASY